MEVQDYGQEHESHQGNHRQGYPLELLQRLGREIDQWRHAQVLRFPDHSQGRHGHRAEDPDRHRGRLPRRREQAARQRQDGAAAGGHQEPAARWRYRAPGRSRVCGRLLCQRQLGHRARRGRRGLQSHSDSQRGVFRRVSPTPADRITRRALSSTFFRGLACST